MRAFLIFFCLSLSTLLVACSAKQPLTPEEIAAERERQLAMTSRVYEGVTVEQVLTSADRIFRLADEDYKISHAPGGLNAKRDWIIYLVLVVTTGTDSWSVTAETLPDGKVKVVALCSPTAQSVTGGPTMGGGATALTSPVIQRHITRPAIYQLFFSRLDYLLGNSDSWITCKEAAKIFTDGSLEAFCTVANDRTPDEESRAGRRDAAEAGNKNASALF